MLLRLIAVVTLPLVVLSLPGCDDRSDAAPSADAAAAAAPQPLDQPITGPAPAPPDVAPGVSGAPAATAEAPAYERLHDLMEDVERSFRFLRQNMADADIVDLQRHAATLRRLSDFARVELTPDEQLVRAAEADRASLLATYHEQMARFPAVLDELDAALAADDRAAGAAAVEKLHDLEHESHEALGVEEH